MTLGYFYEKVAPLLGRLIIGAVFLMAVAFKVMFPAGQVSYIAAAGIPYGEILVWVAAAFELWIAYCVITGKVTEYSFHVSDKVEEAEIESREVKYLYNARGEWWFCEAEDPSKRFKVTDEQAGPQAKFLKPNTIVEQLLFDEQPMGFKMPISAELRVTEAPPGIKGDTATGGNKVVTLETGATINVPLFVNEGDVIRINTDTGEYRERVGK